MNIILFGPQGSGKGTQARLLSDKFGLFYFESGAYLRRISETHPELKKILDSGQLVADEEMTSYLTAYFDQEHIYDDILLDGFPRTVEQYNFLKVWMSQKGVKIDLGIVIEISEDESVKRVSARRIDPATGEIYNLLTDLPPAEVNVDSLIQRDDDKPESIKRRLGLYRSRTEDLIKVIEKDCSVVRINGERPVDEIHNEIVEIIEKTVSAK